MMNLQGDSRRMLNILGGDRISNLKISSYKHASDSDWLSRHGRLNVACTVCPPFLSNLLRFLFVQLDKEQSIQMKGGDTRQIACLHSGCCSLHEEI